jgi:UDP-glucose 4-epimerase
MVVNKIKKIIFSSSCATYGTPNKIPITEKEGQNPLNPYGRTKLIIENAIKDFSSTYGTKYIILRYFNAAGADPDGECGEMHNPETHLIPNVINAALNPKICVNIFGNDYPTPDGSCIRDYIHVSDLADAHVTAMEMLIKNKVKNDCINLGSEKGTSNLEIVKIPEKITNKKIKVKLCPARPGDPARLVASAGKAKKVLHFKPKYSTIENIILHAYAWRIKLNKICQIKN